MERQSRCPHMEESQATPKVMKLIDAGTGEMECKVCGSSHWIRRALLPG